MLMPRGGAEALKRTQELNGVRLESLVKRQEAGSSPSGGTMAGIIVCHVLIMCGDGIELTNFFHRSVF